jgi:hypothetical protein
MILDRLRRKKKEGIPEIPRNEFLKMIPVRNPQLKWDRNEEGNVRIFVPLKKSKKEDKRRKKKRQGPLSRILATPKEKRVQLDTIGSIVWDACDGKRTMKDIFEHLYKKYKMLPSEAEVSLNAYFNQLTERGLVGFIAPEKTRARFEEAVKKEKKKRSRKRSLPHDHQKKAY